MNGSLVALLNTLANVVINGWVGLILLLVEIFPRKGWML